MGCTDISGVGISCNCGWLYTGKYCEQARTCTNDNPCVNGATCTYASSSIGVICSCRTGWGGPTCSQNSKN